MDFSNNVFRPPQLATSLSDDTMNHANMVMACRWGWSSSGPDTSTMHAPPAPITVPHAVSNNPTNHLRSQRFAPCRGRLYHQLLCGHKVRTDLVEDCGPNCLEPFGNASDISFWCQQCIDQEAAKILEVREIQLNSNYPPLDQMTREQYDEWFDLHRKLEAEFARDRKMYEVERKAATRPSNTCSVLEVTKEEMDFTAELDSLSLSMMSSQDSIANMGGSESQARNRISLPSDASEQLHWGLNTLALDRGSCGVEYSVPQDSNIIATMRPPDEDELWKRPRQ